MSEYLNSPPIQKPNPPARNNQKHIIETIISELSQPGTKVFYLDGKEITSQETFFKQVAGAMKFPASFQANWDNFSNCITDLAWVPAEKYVIFYDRAEVFAQADPTEWQITLKNFRLALEYWGKTDTPLNIFLLYQNGLYQLFCR